MIEKPKNFNTLILNSFEQFANRPAMRYLKNGQVQVLTYRDLRAKSMAVIKGLSTYEFEENDTAVTWSENRPEWTWIDLGVLLTGGINIGINPNAGALEAAHIINEVEAKILFISGEKQLEVLKEIIDQLPSLEKIIMLDPLPDDNSDLIAFDWLFELKTHKVIGKIVQDIKDSKSETSILTISYTRGQDSLPKGVILSHENLLSSIQSLSSHLEKELSPKMDQSLSVLPLAGVFERLIGYYMILALGRCMGFLEKEGDILQGFKTIKPKMICGEPALYQQIHENLLAAGRSKAGFRTNIFNWSIRIGEKASEHLIKKENIPYSLKIKHKLAKKLRLNKMKQEFGNQTQFFISCGAALNPNIVRFFYALGIPILEGYGCTETTAFISQSTLDNFSVGTVGETLPDLEVKIDTDGEILVKGALVFKNYWKRAKASSRAFTKDGFYKTGDLGKFDAEGNLVILSRKE